MKDSNKGKITEDDILKVIDEENKEEKLLKLYQFNDDSLPKESINLINQSYMTMINVHKLIKCKRLVDSNTLIRADFENLL